MSLDLPVDPEPGAAATAVSSPVPSGQACHFGPLSAPLSGWYHAATASQGHLAVLICPPIGDESIAVHRGLRQLACDLAGAGLPTLRFDPAGTGDSADPMDMAEAEQVSVWLDSVRCAAEALRAASGRPSLALVGVRNGSMIAAQAAFTLGEVAALVALLPIQTGSRYLRECRFQAALRGLPASADGSVAAGGHRYNEATARRLKALDWRCQSASGGWPPRRALVIDRDDQPGGAVCAEQLRAQGTVVVHEYHADLDRLATMAHQSHFPSRVAARIVDWLSGLPPATSVAASRAPDLSVLRAGPAVLQTHCGELVEEHVRVGSAPALAGTVTRPARAASGPAGGHGVLLLASGCERHVGAHRISAVYARERAARGDIVLRLDRAGIGDSESRPGGRENDPFDAAAVADVAAAIAFLRTEYRVAVCSVVGFCAGAYHGWRAAVAGIDVDRLVSINSVAYTASDDRKGDPRLEALQVALLADARRSLVDVHRWKQLLRGEVRLGGIAVAAVGRGRARWRAATRSAARLARKPMADDLTVELEIVGRRGIRQHFVFSPDEPGLAVLREQGGGVLKRLLRDGQVQIEQLVGADHSCTSEEDQRNLRGALHRALDSDLGVRPSAAIPLTCASVVTAI